ncbi:MAG: HAMP domain-containing sensor histidine kinase [Petrimonas sp.]|nr:HAMP domain-containing sensor histidine kinase [Petrimonas sp.]
MKLTNHIATRYIGVTAILLLISIPLFYIVLERVMWNSIDENMQFQREWMEEKLQTTSPEHFLSFNNNIQIRPGSFSQAEERFYNEKIYIPNDKEMVSYRVLEFNTEVHGKPYAVRIQKSLVENEDVLLAIVAMQIGVLLVLLLALAFINRNLKKNVWTPFYKILESLRSYRIDRDEPLHLASSKINEINSLNKSLNVLTKHNYEVYKSQKEFTENTSHELQTPLATMQSTLDLLWQNFTPDETQAELMQTLTETNMYMSKLNKSLLLLAKIDNNQFSDKKEINVISLTEIVLARYSENFAQKNINIHENFLSPVIVFAHETLVETLLGNLVSNAFRYTPQNGEVEIKIANNTFTIGNTAENGQPLDKQKLFQRFQRQQPNVQSSLGVGLEICRRICVQSGFEIEYDFTDGKHWFKVIF